MGDPQGNGQHGGDHKAQTTEREGGVLNTRPTRGVSGARQATTMYLPPATPSSSPVNHDSQRARPAQTHCPPPAQPPPRPEAAAPPCPRAAGPGGKWPGPPHPPPKASATAGHGPTQPPRTSRIQVHHRSWCMSPGAPQPQVQRRATQGPTQMPSRPLPSGRRGRKGRRNCCSDLISAPCASSFQ